MIPLERGGFAHGISGEDADGLFGGRIGVFLLGMIMLTGDQKVRRAANVA